MQKKQFHCKLTNHRDHDSIVEFDDAEFESHTTPNHPNDTADALRSQIISIYCADDNQQHRFQLNAWNPLNLWNFAAESVSADTTNPPFRLSIIREDFVDITRRFAARLILSSLVKLRKVGIFHHFTHNHWILAPYFDILQ